MMDGRETSLSRCLSVARLRVCVHPSSFACFTCTRRASHSSESEQAFLQQESLLPFAPEKLMLISPSLDCRRSSSTLLTHNLIVCFILFSRKQDKDSSNNTYTCTTVNGRTATVLIFCSVSTQEKRDKRLLLRHTNCRRTSPACTDAS